MIYRFKCPKCGQKYELNIPISQYSSTGHFCTNNDCSTELQRDYTDIAGASIWKTSGAYGTGKN